MPWAGAAGIVLLVMAGVGFLVTGELAPFPSIVGLVLLCTGLIIRSIDSSRAAQRTTDRTG